MLPTSRSILSYSSSHIPKLRKSFDLSLYLVANKPSYPDENLFISKIMASVRGGVSCVQLRDHISNSAATLKTAIRLKEMLKDTDTPLFINTLHSIDIAHAVDAEGIYLEEQFQPSEIRKLLGRKIIIGIPVKTMDEVLAAGENDEIDYLSVKVHPSKKTCPKNDLLWGMDGLRNIRTISPHRIAAIGGLNLECSEIVYRELHSDDGIAMAGGLMGENNPCVTASEILAICHKIRGKI